MLRDCPLKYYSQFPWKKFHSKQFVQLQNLYYDVIFKMATKYTLSKGVMYIVLKVLNMMKKKILVYFYIKRHIQSE